MIRPNAAKEVALHILKAYTNDPSDLEVSVAASLIVKACEKDEKTQHAEAIEEKL